MVEIRHLNIGDRFRMLQFYNRYCIGIRVDFDDMPVKEKEKYKDWDKKYIWCKFDDDRYCAFVLWQEVEIVIPEKPQIKTGDKITLKNVEEEVLRCLDHAAKQAGWYGDNTPAGTFPEYKDFVGKVLTVSLIDCDGGQFEVAEDTVGDEWSFSVAWIKEIINNEPRNNDGRINCYWCSVPTQKRGGGAYDVCSKCGR